MKNLKLNIVIIALALFQVSVNAQEKKIKFSKGTLKICSSKKFKITGYDGNEVIIKSLNQRKGGLTFATTNGATLNGTATTSAQAAYTIASAYPRKKDSTKGVSVSYFFNDAGRKDGLKKLGKKYENSEYGIYFLIEQRDGELIFKDQQPKRGQYVMFGKRTVRN